MTVVRAGERRVAWLAALGVALPLAPGTAASQPVAQSVAQADAPARDLSAVVPLGRTLRVRAEQRFDRGAGLRSATVYDMAVDTAGHMWIATEDGVYAYAGNGWRRETLPPASADQQVRSLLVSADGTRWMGTRRGLIRARAGVAMQEFSTRDGLQGEVSYSLAETRAIDGTDRVVVGSSFGVSWFNGTRFVALPLPPALSPLGLVVMGTTASDGTPALWVASSRGGVARYRRGAWTVYTAQEGLASPDAQFLLALPAGGAARVYASGIGGVFALDASEKRFVRVPGSPTGAVRMAAVPGAGGAPSLWVGTSSGQVTEWMGGDRWRAVPLRTDDRRGAVTLLRAVPGASGGAAVYVSSRGDYLSRLSVGVAGRVDLNAGEPEDRVYLALALPGPDGRDELWLRTSRVGVLHVPARGPSQRYARATGAPFDTVLDLSLGSVAPPRPAGGASSPGDAAVLITTPTAVYARRDGRFVPLQAGLEQRSLRRTRRLTMPDGRNVLVTGTDDGLFEWSGTRWAPSRFAVTGSVTSLLEGDGVLYAGGTHVVRRLTPSGTVEERLPDEGAHAVGTGFVTAICRTMVGGVPHLFAHDSERGVFWRAESGPAPWALLPVPLLTTVAALGTTSVACLPTGLLVSTLSGLVAIDVRAPTPAAWTVTAQVAESDGLPSSEVLSVARSGSSGVFWVATGGGLGLVDLEAASARIPVRLGLLVTAGETGREVTEGVALAPDEHDLHVEPMLLSYHREEDTRYRVRLQRRDRWFGRGGDVSAAIADRVAPPEPDSPNRYYLDLEPGAYVLDVWAYDWAGREYGPVQRTFRVRAPVWRAWYALLLYGVLLAGLAAAAYRWRVMLVRDNARQLLESERRLRDSERKFRTIFDRAMDAHLLVEDGHVIAANAMAAQLFGVDTPEALQQRRLTDLFPGITGDGTSAPPEEFDVPRGEETVPVQCTITEVPNEGRVLRQVVLRDLTEVRQAEAEKRWFESQVREAQKLESLGTLAGGVAHDFNNLLGVIRGNAELGRSALRKGRSNEENLGAILDASDRARDVVRQILTFSRRSTPTREFVNLSRLVLDLQPLLRRMIPRTVSMVIEGAEQPLLMMGDPTQLQQLMLNLVSNAEYAMRAKTDGVLTIALSARIVPASEPAPHGDVIVLQVRDTGVGMTAEVRSRIFEPFFTTKPTGEGTGLGMAVLHGIVLSHEGRAHVISEPGQGTTFEVQFPRVEVPGLWDEEPLDDDLAADLAAAILDDAGPRDAGPRDGGHPDEGAAAADAYRTAVEAEQAGVLEQSPFAGSCLVVVDDEPGVSRVVERALQYYGHTVHVFAQPEAALAFIQRQPSAVDLLITDQTMPVMTGDMLAEAVHVLRPDLPVLILTGFSHRLTPARIAASGARAVLLKPVALDDLRAAVDDALASART